MVPQALLSCPEFDIFAVFSVKYWSSFSLQSSFCSLFVLLLFNRKQCNDVKKICSDILHVPAHRVLRATSRLPEKKQPEISVVVWLVGCSFVVLPRKMRLIL